MGVVDDARTPAQATLSQEFGTLPELIRAYARQRGERIAVADGACSLTYKQLDARMDHAATAMQRHGVIKGAAAAIARHGISGLPRSSIGKVLKRELRTRWAA